MTKHIIIPGIHDISNEAYHSSNGVSRSGLMKLKKSRLHYWYEYISEQFVKPDDTSAMLFGSALHCMVLEPGEFLNRYTVMPKIDRRTTAGKEVYAKMLAMLGDKQLISEEQYLQIIAMAKAISFNPQAAGVLKDGFVEKSIYWNDPDTGIMCKCRPDLWHNNMIIDLKTTVSASYRDFQGSCYKYGYHIQAAMIQEGIYHATGNKINDFIFVAIEKDAPYASAVYVLHESAIAQGLVEFKRLLKTLKESQEQNDWHGYETEVLTLPSWADNEVIA